VYRHRPIAMAAIATDTSSADGWVSEYFTHTSSADGRASLACQGSGTVGGRCGGSQSEGSSPGSQDSQGSQSSLPPTHPKENLTPTDERNRLLELAKYFAASQIVPASQSAIGDAEVAAAPSAPAADTTLTALAQLGTFKLSCDRAFISLINSTHQYIIGEATQSTSLIDNALRPDDGLCLGVRALELAFGVCPQTIQIFTSDDRTISTPNIQADSSRYVIKDFTADSHFSTRPYVSGWPHMRSYAEVPLKSASGYVVGSYCVVDTRPRDFDDSEIQVLDSVAVTIMNHLELLKSQLEFHRVQSLVRGIGSYAAGYSGLQEHQTRPSLEAPTQPSSLQPAEEEMNLPVRLVRDDSSRTITRPAMARVYTDKATESVSDASLGTPMNSDLTWTTSDSGYSDVSELRADGIPDGDDGWGRRGSVESSILGEKPGPSHSNSSDEARGDTALSKATSKAVSRASHLIRQSMDLGGVVFVVSHTASSPDQSQLTLQSLETAREKRR
jgi:GAF domain-containing protein